MTIRHKILSVFIVFTFKLFAGVPLPVDSVLHYAMNAAEKYSNMVREYDANVYMRTFVDTKKKNFLYQYTHLIPNFVLHDRNNNQAVIESVSRLRYNAPHNYFQDINYLTGTLTSRSDIALLPFKFISLNVYSESAPEESFYLPLRHSTSKYYNYTLSYMESKGNHNVYYVNFTPKYKNPKLISGFFMVEDSVWSVTGFSGKGTDLFVSFSFDIKMGEGVYNRFLPVNFNIVQTYTYLGNKVSNTYQADISYKWVEYNRNISKSKKKNYNLGNRYRVRLDSLPLNNDSVLWSELRTFPLTELEKLLLEQHHEKELRSRNQPVDSSRENNLAAMTFAKNIVMNTNYRLKSTNINYSGIFNPSMIGYSTRDGLTYRQSLAVGIELQRWQSIKLNAFGGYVSKRKMLHYGLTGVWNYEPLKLGYLSLSMGRGNPSYSSRFLSSIKDEVSHNGLNFNDLESNYYKDYYFRLYNSIELTNGFQLGAGVEYHIREPNKISSSLMLYDGINDMFTTQYNFVPVICLSWTPGQYYITDRSQKVYTRSDYPTFKIEYAQSLANVLKSESSYNRVEFDVSQKIRFDLMRNLNYRVGAGIFAHQKNEYFNDFAYFTKNYFPEMWGDGVGGSFSMLPTRYFNSSDRYAQAHLMYETPNFLFTRLRALSEGVARERIYISQLYTPLMISFTEVGYGIGNRFLNAAVFVAFHKLKYQNITAKVVFVL